MLFNYNTVLLMFIQAASWMKHKLESRLPGEIAITSDTQMTPPLWQKAKKKNLVMKVKEESEKVGSTFRKLRSWHPVPSLHGK